MGSNPPDVGWAFLLLSNLSLQLRVSVFNQVPQRGASLLMIQLKMESLLCWLSLTLISQEWVKKFTEKLFEHFTCLGKVLGSPPTVVVWSPLRTIGSNRIANLERDRLNGLIIH